MPQVFIVDQAASFQATAFLASEPKMVMGSQGQQETAKDGTPKWEIQVVTAFRDNFGKTVNEVMKVGFTGSKDPGEGIAMYTPVHLVNFTVGVMDKTRRNRETGQTEVIGAQIWYRCDGIQAANASPAPARKSGE
jgi:hypothetical protein